MEKIVIPEREKGQSFVELAVSFTILLVVLAGLMDVGSIFFSYMSLRDAAQEGVNYGMYSPRDLTGIEARVRNASTSPLDLTDTTVVKVSTIEDANPCVGKSITVRVTYHFEIAAPFIGTILGSQKIPVSAEANGTIVSGDCQ